MTVRFTALFAAVVALGMLCAGITGCQRAHPPIAAEPVAVAVETLGTVRLRDITELDGSVAPLQQVNLVARVAGTLEEIRFKDGEPVHAGQVLFVIEQPPYVDQLNLNRAKLEQCQADYRRQQELLRENANSQSNVETSLSNLKQAQANVQLAELNLDYTVVKAPFDGVIGRRLVDVGNYVGATQGGTVLATLMQISPAYVYASIGEREAIRVREQLAADRRGAPAAGHAVGRTPVYARLQGEAAPGEAGVLDFIDHQVNAASGTIQVRGRFDNATYHFVPGFYAKLSIPVGPERDALVLPSAVIQSDQQGDFVYVVGNESRASRRNVSTVLLAGEKREIVSGLRAGERVVMRGGNMISDGQPVRTVAADRIG